MGRAVVPGFYGAQRLAALQRRHLRPHRPRRREAASHADVAQGHRRRLRTRQLTVRGKYVLSAALLARRLFFWMIRNEPPWTLTRALVRPTIGRPNKGGYGSDKKHLVPAAQLAVCRNHK